MERVMVVGSGLVGSLLAIYLARLGYRVEVYDRRADPRSERAASGKSINITLCERGFRALDRVGAGDLLRPLAIPAYGRVMHDLDGTTHYQPYGNSGEAIHSISRNDINKALLSYAEERGSIDLHFHAECLDIDLERPAARFRNLETGGEAWVTADRILGADGAFSAVRSRLQKRDRFEYSQQFVAQGYKELNLPAAADDDWRLDQNAIHIWPRGRYMLIGFANTDGSFTVALHLPFEGEPSFESITTGADVVELFERFFPDALPLIPGLVADFFDHPVSSMVTVRCSPWTYQDKVALVGDAAHAIVPSYGQGANCGFEDCSVLSDCLEAANGDWPTALAEYERQRKPNADAIADLALEHFAELQELVGDSGFLLRKRIERRINELYPDRYSPLYSMISFTDLTYVEALRIEKEQRAMVERFLAMAGIEEMVESRKIDRWIHEALGARTEARAAAG